MYKRTELPGGGHISVTVAPQPTGNDCAWCGGDCYTEFKNRRGEIFCSKSHRQASNKALNDFLARDDKEHAE